MKNIIFRLIIVFIICFLLSLLTYALNPEFSDHIAETIMKKLGYSDEQIYNSSTGWYLIGAIIAVLGLPLFLIGIFIKNVLPFISVNIVALFATTLVTAPFEWNMGQLFSAYGIVTLFNLIVISLLPIGNNFVGKLKTIFEIPLIYGTFYYFVLGLGLWFAGGIFSITFTLHKANWEGSTFDTIYAFTNAMVYLLGFIIFAVIYNISNFLSNSDSISDINVSFTGLQSVKKFLGHPFIVFTLAVMTLHRFTFYAPINPLFEEFSKRGWGMF